MTMIQEPEAFPYPGREVQYKTLETLFSPNFPTPSNIVIHGLPSTGKSIVTKAVLKHVNSFHIVVSSKECITIRHLLEKTASESWNIVKDLIELSSNANDQPRIDSINTLENYLEKLLRSVSRKKFVIVFDGIDKQKELTSFTIPGLARISSIIPNLSIVFIITIPSPRYFYMPGIPHIDFSSYTKEESIKIISLNPPKIFIHPVDKEYDYGEEEEREDINWLWPKFCTIVWDTLGKATSKDIKSFRSICFSLWKPFVQPILDGKFGTRDFTKLTVATRNIFQNENIVSGNYVKETDSQGHQISMKSLDDLPYYAKFILCGAYLASYNPSRLDSLHFMKSTEKGRRKRKRMGAKASKNRKIPRHLLNPSPFSLDRLLSIVHSLLPNKLPLNAQILPQVAILMSLRLIVKQGALNSDSLDASNRYKVNCSLGYVISIGRSVGLEVRDYLAT